MTSVTYVPEGSTHDNGLVSMLLVVVEDLLHGHDTRVLIASIGRAGLGLLVPVEDLRRISASSTLLSKSAITYTADEGRDEGNTSLRTRNGLREAEEEGEVTVDAVVALELAGGLDTLPGRGDLDEDALLLDPDRLVERNELLGLGLRRLLVVGEAGVDLGRDTAGDDLEDLLAEFDELHRPRQVHQPDARREKGPDMTRPDSRARNSQGGPRQRSPGHRYCRPSACRPGRRRRRR